MIYKEYRCSNHYENLQPGKCKVNQPWPLFLDILKEGNLFETLQIKDIFLNRIPFSFQKNGVNLCQLRSFFSSLGYLLFYRCVRTVTHHLRSITFYFTDVSEPSHIIFTKIRNNSYIFILNDAIPRINILIRK